MGNDLLYLVYWDVGLNNQSQEGRNLKQKNMKLIDACVGWLGEWIGVVLILGTIVGVMCAVVAASVIIPVLSWVLSALPAPTTSTDVEVQQ